MKFRCLKFIATFISVTFLMTSLNPVSFANTPELLVSPFKTLEIPSEFGQVTDNIISDPAAPALIHIQSAHGNYTAEKNIEKLLGYIEQNSKVRLLLLEGAANKLQPELFRMFPQNPEFNHKVTDKFMQEGYLTGPENFLIEVSNRSEGWGIEDLGAYQKDRDAFIAVVKADKTAQVSLREFREALDRQFTAKLSKDLLALVRQETSLDAGTLSYEGWLKLLAEASKKHLKLDLADAFYQREFPFLVRYARLQVIGSKIDREKAYQEAGSFLKDLETRKISGDILSNFRTLLRTSEAELLRKDNNAQDYSSLRRAFDLAFEKLPKNFSMEAWPHWTLYAQYIILMQELEGKGLHEEVLRLKDRIQDSLAKSADEKKYLSLVRDLRLLRRLFELELTRSEFESLQNQDISIDGFLTAVKGDRKTLKASPALQGLFVTAINFYKTAVVREERMFQNALKKMGELKENRAVIITGGFHTEGLKKLAAAKGCSYLQITPRITEVSKRDREIYLRSILGTREFETSQMSPILGSDPLAMQAVLRSEVRDWFIQVDNLVTGLISTQSPSLRSTLTAAFSRSSFNAMMPSFAAHGPVDREAALRQQRQLERMRVLPAAGLKTPAAQRPVGFHGDRGQPKRLSLAEKRVVSSRPKKASTAKFSRSEVRGTGILEIGIYDRSEQAYSQIKNAVEAERIPGGLPLIVFGQHSGNAKQSGARPDSSNWLTWVKEERLIGDAFWVHPDSTHYPNLERYLMGDRAMFKAVGYDLAAMLKNNVARFRRGVVLAFDLDHFVSHTFEGAPLYNPAAGEITKRVEEIFTLLKTYGIPVYLINGAYSMPEYTQETGKRYKLGFERQRQEFQRALSKAAEKYGRALSVEEFAELVDAGTIAAGATIDIHPKSNDAITNASFHRIGTDGRVYYLREDAMPEANPESLASSAIRSIVVRSEIRSVADIEAFRNPPQSSVFRLTRIQKDARGVSIVSNGFFNDGLFTDDAAMAHAFNVLGAANLTTNQSIARKKSNTWRPLVQQSWAQGLSPQEAFLRAYFAEGKKIYDFLAPVRDEFSPMAQVSVEGSALAGNEAELTASMQAIDALMPAGERLLVKLPNIRGPVAEVPAVDEDGPRATFERAKEFKSINITLGFAMHQYLAHAFRLIHGVVAGVRQAKREGKGDEEIRQLLAAMNTVFSLFMTRNDRLVVPMIDKALEAARAAKDDRLVEELRLLRGKTGVAMGRFTGQVMQHIFLNEPLNDIANFLTLEEKGVIEDLRMQYQQLHERYGMKPLYVLIASSGKYPEQLYATDLQYSLPFLGKGMWNTLPPAAIKALSAFVAGLPAEDAARLAARNLVGEEIPWIRQAETEAEAPKLWKQWDAAILMTPEERWNAHIASRSASWILKRTQDLVLNSGFSGGLKSFVATGNKLRDAGAAGFEKDEIEMLAMIRGWYAIEELKRVSSDTNWTSNYTSALRSIEEGVQLLISAPKGYETAYAEKYAAAVSLIDALRGIVSPRAHPSLQAAKDLLQPQARSEARSIENLNRIATIVRKGILEMLFKPKSGHPGGSLSAAEILTTLYFGGVLRYDPKDPHWENRDRVVLSAGHKAPALYAILAEAGFFPKEEFKHLRETPEAMLQGHVDMHQTPGVDLSTGALGQGFSSAIGMAAGARMLGKDLHVWSILGGGEEQEGQISEAARHAAALGLTNQTAILDNNGYQIEGAGSKVDAADIQKTWEGYGWNVVVVDGHDPRALLEAMTQAKASAKTAQKPTLILANTKKGKGVPVFENEPAKSHGEVPKDGTMFGSQKVDYKQIFADLDAQIGAYDPVTLEAFKEAAVITPAAKAAIDDANLASLPEFRPAEVPLKQPKAGEAEATRSSFGSMLSFLSGQDRRIVAMSADLAPSNKMEGFEKLFGRMTRENPTGRYIALGIREAHGASFAQGLALMGLRPFIGTFDIFTLNMAPQMRVAAMNRIPIVFVKTHSGVGVGEDAKSHQSTESPGVVDLLSGPNGDLIDIYEPADAEETGIVMQAAMKAEKPVYLRLSRQDLPVLDKSGIANYGQKVLEGSYVLRDPGQGENDLIVVATGGTIANAVKASEQLKETLGLNVKVINVVSLNRIDKKDNPFQTYLENGVPILTVGDAYAKVLQNPVLRATNEARLRGKNPGAVHAKGITVLGSAPWQEMYKRNGFDVAGIVASVKDITAGSARSEVRSQVTSSYPLLSASLKPGVDQALKKLREAGVPFGSLESLLRSPVATDPGKIEALMGDLEAHQYQHTAYSEFPGEFWQALSRIPTYKAVPIYDIRNLVSVVSNARGPQERELLINYVVNAKYDTSLAGEGRIISEARPARIWVDNEKVDYVNQRLRSLNEKGIAPRDLLPILAEIDSFSYGADPEVFEAAQVFFHKLHTAAFTDLTEPLKTALTEDPAVMEQVRDLVNFLKGLLFYTPGIFLDGRRQGLALIEYIENATVQPASGTARSEMRWNVDTVRALPSVQALMQHLTQDGLEPRIGSVTPTSLVINTSHARGVPDMADVANLGLIPFHVAVMQETGLTLQINSRSEVRKVREGVLPRVDPTKTEAWKALKQLATEMKKAKNNLRALFQADPQRVSKFVLALRDDFKLDFSKQRITDAVLDALVKLAEQTGVQESIQKMFIGEKINETEDRAVLHVALRNVKRDPDTGRLVAANGPILVDGKDVMPDVIKELEKMESFVKKIHNGERTGHTGKRIKNIVNIGIGGSDLGGKMAVKALTPYQLNGKEGVNVYFVSNVDGTDLAEATRDLDPEETLFVIASKTFTTQETMQNAASARTWILGHYGLVATDASAREVVNDHFVALSTAKTEVTAFGINPDEDHMFEFWDWVGGRYSVWSAIGLPLATYIGFDNFLKFLEGGRYVDDHFRSTPLRRNIPVIKALLNIWNGDFLGARSFAVLPYDQYLGLFPEFAQQFFMESNGKRTSRLGRFVRYLTGLILWGAAGTNGQHSFYQLLHQGTHLVPADFIGVLKTHNLLPGHHEKLFSNVVAQAEALAFGASKEEVKRLLAEDAKYQGRDIDWNAAQQTFPGNKPSTTILIDEVSPETLGMMVALYEHQIFVEGVIWNIFSFDQWGVQLGKKVAVKVLEFLTGKKGLDQIAAAGISKSGEWAIRQYLERGGGSLAGGRAGVSATQRPGTPAVSAEHGETARSEVRKTVPLETEPVQWAAQAARPSSFAAVLRTVELVTAGILPITAVAKAFASGIAQKLFPRHFNTPTVIPAAFDAWKVFRSVLAHLATASGERALVDLRQGVPDVTSVLPLVAFARYNPKAEVTLALVADAADVKAFEKRLVAAGAADVLIRNFKVDAFPSTAAFGAQFNAKFYNAAVPLGKTLGLVTDREDAVLKARIGAHGKLLSVVGDTNPLKQTASALLVADKLLGSLEGFNPFIAIQALDREGRLGALMAELTGYLAAQAAMGASA